MQRHIEQAANAGASKSQILEAIEVGIEMDGGPATAQHDSDPTVMTVFSPT